MWIGRAGEATLGSRRLSAVGETDQRKKMSEEWATTPPLP